MIGGTFFTIASHGTDQLIVQRLLAARSQKQSVTALISSGVAILFQFALFLTVGVMLWAYYRLPILNLWQRRIGSIRHSSSRTCRMGSRAC